MTIALIMLSILTACLLVLCGTLVMVLQELRMKIKYLKMMTPVVTVTRNAGEQAPEDKDKSNSNN